MTSAEMHAFEKQMLSDPFLADAVEGYREQWQDIRAKEDLIQLEEKIQKRNNNKTKVIVGGFRQWMSIAALLVVLLSSAVVLFRIFSTVPETNKVAATEKEQTLPTEPGNKIIPETKVDSQTVAVNENVNTERIKTKPAVSVKTVPSKTAANEDLPATSPDTTSMASAEQKLPAKISGAATQPAVAPESPPVAVQIEETRERDEALVSKKERAKANVMIAQPATAMKEKATPVSGWTEYTNYINEHKKTPSEISAKDQNRFTVEVSFYVDTDGSLSNFKIEKSTCQPCNTEAIRLIKEGPDWKTNTGKKERVSYTISFN